MEEKIIHCADCCLHGVCAIEASLKQIGQKPEESYCSMAIGRGAE